MRIVSLSLCLMALLAASVSLSGCGNKPAESEDAPLSCDGAEHLHPTEGPHGGDLIELGNEEYHAELLRDEKTNTVTVHLLDGPAKKSVAIAEPEITLQLLRDGKFTKYTLKAVQSKDASGKGAASEFKIVDQSLTEALCHDEKTQGKLQVTIDGKPYTGDVKLSGHDHDHDDHDNHDHDDHDDHDHDDHAGHNH